MTLGLPLGLLGLIAIAGLILIYILKPKYQEKKFASTYVWKLSLKHVKRKIPLQIIQSSLLFLLQLILLASFAFSMANPSIILNTKSGEKIVILDASASMMAETDGKTRFELAKDQISALVDTTTESHKISIILAGEESSFVIRRSDSASYVKQKLFEAQCGLSQVDFSDAMELAEGVLVENPSAEVYLYTDTDYEDSGKVNVVNVSKSEWNAAVLGLTAKREKGSYVFTAQIASYNYQKTAEIAVSLVVDGKTQMPKLAVCEDGQTVDVVWDNLAIGTFDHAEVHVSAKDSFVYDNDFHVYNSNTERFKVQLVSDDPGFLYSVLSVQGNCQIVVPDENNPAKSYGFDLYVYDNYVPTVVPSDGTVWLINPPSEITATYGISLGTVRNGEYNLSSSGSGSETAKALLSSISPSSVYVTEYTKINTYAGYESIMQCNNDPVLLAKNDNGLKTIILAFDIHMSDLPLNPKFPLFIGDLCDYSMSYTIDKTIYEVGENVKLNAKPDTTAMSVTASYTDGTNSESGYDSFPVEISTEKSGVYTVTQTTMSGRTITDTFFARIAENESVFGKTEEKLVNPVAILGSGTDNTVKNDTLDIYDYLCAVILLLLCVEWGIQYREQY